MKSRTPSRPGGSLLHDRVLCQRLESCLEADTLKDMDDVTNYLRDTFPEYRRQKFGPFKLQLQRAADAVARRRPELFGNEGESDGVQTAAAEPTVSPAAVSNLSRSMLNLYKTPQDGVRGSHASGAAPVKAPSPNASSGTPGSALHAAMDMEETGTGGAVVETPQRATGAGAGPGSAALQGKRGGGMPSRPSSMKKARVGSLRGMSLAMAPPNPVYYADLGGIEHVLQDIKQLVEYPVKHPEVYDWLGVEPPRGLLLHGPPGCGKTALANAIANECGVPFFRISAPELVSGMSGESEENIRQLFQRATASAPAIIFIDEIDAIAPKRESAQREMERRIVAQLLTSMDDLSAPASEAERDVTMKERADEGADGTEVVQPPRNKHVVVIGATNRPDAIDTALRRAGRFDREIAVGIPTEKARARILEVLTRKMRLEGSLGFMDIARRTPGFVGADLEALMKEAAALAVQRIFSALDASPSAVPEGGLKENVADVEQQPVPRLGQGALTAEELSPLAITAEDVEVAITKVQPSVRREGFATTPNTTWDDVGALADVREELEFAIIKPIMHPELFAAMGLQTGSGILLFGPPGCGKTLVAKAAAHESGANFISIKGPELLNKYVGESERAVRQVFARARAAAPCVLFFDEMDALAPRRGGEASQSSERLVNQLLTEMDGVDQRASVFLIAATNRPDIIDPALLRPGRLDKVLYVPLPDAAGRTSILQALAQPSTERKGVPLAPDIDLSAVGESSWLDGYSGADLAALLREASVLALKDCLAGGMSLGGDAALETPRVTRSHLERAARMVQPSVSARDHRMYQCLRNRLRSSRGHLVEERLKDADTAAQ